ncbi:nitronate monooxygenase [Streptomyces sp. VNUA24]|uniref:nitronate monooxygenase n=1 Tax=Streptomyces sp. VNUA24 TaxID=3031131 RepID=UPI0023B83749|nr:nitronate monooxygenase [Streptomyces sp. VNUA24]WEH19918.1 nitronate monooxygenase [Streptomyces sp. VNUA24]
MSRLLSGIGARLPIIAAPMAGGPSTPALVAAAARAGGLRFLAGGYKTAQALAGQIHTTRTEGVNFGVNLFVPNPVPVSEEAYRRHAREAQAEADRYGISLPEEPIEDDDHWKDKIDLLISAPVPWVSFTSVSRTARSSVLYGGPGVLCSSASPRPMKRVERLVPVRRR